MTLSVASGKLMSVEYYKRGEGSTGHLVLQTTKDSWEYTGSVDADNVNNAAVTVGENVTWNGAMDSDNNAVSTAVTVESGAVWNLTGNSYVTTLTNNGTIITNGYTLSYKTISGSGNIDATTGIGKIHNSQSSNSKSIYTLGGRHADGNVKGIVIQQGKKAVKNLQLPK